MKFRREIINYRKNPTEVTTFTEIEVEPVKKIDSVVFSNHPSHKCKKELYLAGEPADGWLNPEQDGIYILSTLETWVDRDEEWFDIFCSFQDAKRALRGDNDE